jgi:hypothetical protein
MPVKSLVFRYLENLKRGFFMESLRPFISFASGCIRPENPLVSPSNSRYAVADCSTQGKLNGPFLNQFTGRDVASHCLTYFVHWRSTSDCASSTYPKVELTRVSPSNSRYAVADCSTQGKLNGPFLNQFTGEGSHQRPNSLSYGETRGFSGSSSPST